MANGINYTPPPTCEAMIASEVPYSFIVGPVGSGKTTAIIFKILYHAFRQRPSPVDGIRRTRWVVIRNSNRQLQDTTLKSFFQWFPPNVAGQWLATQKTFVFRMEGIECEILFRPLDSPDDVSNVLSLEVTGAVLDEFVEIPREIVDAVQSRCGRYPASRDGGCTWSGVWGASNPGNEDSWWFDWLYEPWPDDDGSIKATTLAYFEQPSGFSARAENLDNLPPYDPKSNEYYHKLALGKTDAWVKQYIEVRWGYSLKGKPVYRTFNPDFHVAKKPLIYQPRLPLVVGFDAGLTPAAVLGQQDMYGRVLVLAELTSENMGARRFCQTKLKPLLTNQFSGNGEILVYADPACKQRAQTDERSVAFVLEEELKVKVKVAYSNTLTDRLGAVENYLNLLTEVGPAYLIDPACKTLARGFTSGYRYPLSAKGVTGDTPEKNSYSHPHDANQYMCMAFYKSLAREASRRKAQVRLPRFVNSYR